VKLSDPKVRKSIPITRSETIIWN